MKPEIKRARGAVVHTRVQHIMTKIGSDISIARRVRKWTAEDFAKRICVSRSTLHRLESGDASVTLNTFIVALHALGRLDALAELTDPARDHVTMSQMMAAVPLRIVKPRKKKEADAALEDVPDEDGYVGF